MMLSRPLVNPQVRIALDSLREVLRPVPRLAFGGLHNRNYQFGSLFWIALRGSRHFVHIGHNGHGISALHPRRQREIKYLGAVGIIAI